jgi:hypothetical protein
MSAGVREPKQKADTTRRPRERCRCHLRPLLLLFAAVAVRPALGNIFEGDVELLKKAASVHKANFDSLRTWKGEASEEITATGEGRPDYLARNKITFAYDRVHSAVRWDKDPQEFHAGPGAEDYAAEADHQSNMIIGGTSYYYSWVGWTAENGARSYDLIVGGPERSSNWGASQFNIGLFFAHPASELPGDEELMRVYNLARMPKERAYDEKTGRRLEGQVTQNGDLVIVKIELTLDTEGNKVINKDVYDLSRGGNLIECHNVSPDADNLYTYEYEEKAGVWVPKSCTRVTAAKKSNGEYRRRTRTIKWGTSTLNVPFAENEFTLAKMGMQPGDQIHDHRAGPRRYPYTGDLADSNLLDLAPVAGDGQLLATGGTAPNTSSRAMPIYPVLVVLSVVVGVAGGVYALTLRRREK